GKISMETVYCSLNKKLKESVNCSLLALSQNKEDSINFTFDNDTNDAAFSMTDKVVNYFGLYDKNNLNVQKISTSLTGHFLLLSTEFKLDAYLVGFELYAVNPGQLTLYVIDFKSNCENYSSCAEYFYLTNPNLDSFEKTSIVSITLTKGYNLHQLTTPVWITKGKMIYLYTNVSNLLAIAVANDAEYSDHVQKGCLYNVTIGLSWRFLLNALVDKNFYLNQHIVTKQFGQGTDLLDYAITSIEAQFDQRLLSNVSKIMNITFLRNEDSIIQLSNIGYIFEKHFNFTVEISTPFAYDTLKVDFGDGQKTQLNLTNIQSQSKFFFGSSKLYYHQGLKNTQQYAKDMQFFLINTETKFDASILGFELYANSGGHVIIGITKFLSCGQIFSCSDYFDNFGTNLSQNVLLSQEYFIQEGFNQLSLCQQRKIPKGSVVFISISAKSTAKFFIEETDLVSDYQQSLDDFIPLHKKRILLNMIFVEQDYSQYSINLNHLYPSYDIFNLNFILENNNLTTFKKNATIELKKNQVFEIICQNWDHVLDRLIFCTLNAFTMEKSDRFIFRDNQVSFENESLNFFGSHPFLEQISTQDTTLMKGSFILPNTEFYYNAYCLGFEFIAVRPGKIDFSIIDFTWCGIQDSCSSWIYLSYPKIDYSKNYCKMSVDAREGYNKVFYEEKCRVKKGNMIMVYVSEPGILALDKKNNSLFSDLKINKTAKAGIKLDQLLNWKFFVNALIDRKYFKNSIDFNVSFNDEILLNLSTNFLNSSVSLTKEYSIFGDESVQIMCWNLGKMLNYEANCSIVGYVFNNYSDVQFSDQNYSQTVKISTSMYSHFGYGMFNFGKGRNSIDIESDAKSFLLINTEFAFDANLFAFELVALKDGLVEIEIISFGELCSEFATCAEYFRLKPSYSNESIIFKEKFNVSFGYNLLALQYSVRVSKKSMITIHTQHENQIFLDSKESYFYSDLIDDKKILLRHDFNKNYRFQFNCLIDRKYYRFETNKMLKFSSKGSQNITIRVFNKKIIENLKGKVYISNSEYF
ncbi:hypothetical protein BpHYR1_052488, partial [Brachionus plicatilis]